MEKEQNRNKPACQLISLPELSEPTPRQDICWQRRNRVKRIIKRRWIYLRNLFREMINPKSLPLDRVNEMPMKRDLEPGDRVKVRSKEEIQKTLNGWNQLKGCSFMEEMWSYCGSEQIVLKKVERFLDERDYLLKKCKNLVILDGVMCQGTIDFGSCDRSCYFFWREEWLEKI